LAARRLLRLQVDSLPVKVFPQTPAAAWNDLAEEFTPTFWSDEHWRLRHLGEPTAVPMMLLLAPFCMTTHDDAPKSCMVGS